LKDAIESLEAQLGCKERELKETYNKIEEERE